MGTRAGERGRSVYFAIARLNRGASLAIYMIHFRIIGAIWVLSCLPPAVKLPFDLWAAAVGRPTSFGDTAHGAAFWISQALVEASFIFVAWMGIGLWRRRNWAVVSSRFVAMITMIVCLWFVIFQGRQHGIQPYAACWFGVAFALYTFAVAWKVRPSPQAA